MSDRIAPGVQLIQLGLASGASRIVLTHHVPEAQTKSREVGADVPRIGIAAVHSARENELFVQQPVKNRRLYRPQDGVDALGVEVARIA